MNTNKNININIECLRGKGIKFDRIRRITGYLTGSLDNWGDSKIAEEKDRVKHNIKEG